MLVSQILVVVKLLFNKFKYIPTEIFPLGVGGNSVKSYCTSVRSRIHLIVYLVEHR